MPKFVFEVPTRDSLPESCVLIVVFAHLTSDKRDQLRDRVVTSVNGADNVEFLFPNNILSSLEHARRDDIGWKSGVKDERVEEPEPEQQNVGRYAKHDEKKSSAVRVCIGRCDPTEFPPGGCLTHLWESFREVYGLGCRSILVFDFQSQTDISLERTDARYKGVSFAAVDRISHTHPAFNAIDYVQEEPETTSHVVVRRTYYDTANGIEAWLRRNDFTLTKWYLKGPMIIHDPKERILAMPFYDSEQLKWDSTVDKVLARLPQELKDVVLDEVANLPLEQKTEFPLWVHWGDIRYSFETPKVSVVLLGPASEKQEKFILHTVKDRHRNPHPAHTVLYRWNCSLKASRADCIRIHRACGNNSRCETLLIYPDHFDRDQSVIKRYFNDDLPGLVLFQRKNLGEAFSRLDRDSNVYLVGGDGRPTSINLERFTKDFELLKDYREEFW